MKTNTRKPAGFTLVELLVVIAIIVALAGFATPALLRQKKKADMTEAVSNAKQIYYLMFDFDSEFGSFPSVSGDPGTDADDEDSGTESQVQNINTDYSDTLGGDSSNAYFRQFFASDFTTSEEIFYAKARGTRKPNGDVDSDAAISAGECGFAYITGQSTSDNGSRPIIMTPMQADSTDFDGSPFDGKAVILRIDGSVKQLRINTEDEAISGGLSLLSTENPIWEEGDESFGVSDAVTNRE